MSLRLGRVIVVGARRASAGCTTAARRPLLMLFLPPLPFRGRCGFPSCCMALGAGIRFYSSDQEQDPNRRSCRDLRVGREDEPHQVSLTRRCPSPQQGCIRIIDEKTPEMYRRDSLLAAEAAR